MKRQISATTWKYMTTAFTQRQQQLAEGTISTADPTVLNGAGPAEEVNTQQQQQHSSHNANSVKNTDTREDPVTIAEALQAKDANKWKAALALEVRALQESGAIHVLSKADVSVDIARSAISTRVVFRRKYAPDGSITKWKARIVARGFEDKTDEATYSPVACQESVKLLFAIASGRDYDIMHSLDFVSAFLQGDLDRDVTVKLPIGVLGCTADETKYAKLGAPLYGLVDAPRAWLTKIRASLEEFGLKRSKVDNCMFTLQDDENQLSLALILYVDDMLVIGNRKPYEKLIRFLHEGYNMKELGPTSKFLGVQVERNRTAGTVSIHQTQYIDEMLEEMNMLEAKSKTTPWATGTILSKDQQPTTKEEFDEMKSTPYINAVGKLLHLARWTRPDVSWIAGKLAKYNSNPGQAHWKAAKRVFRYLKHTRDFKIVYGSDPSNELIGYYDADMAGCADTRRSTSGSVLIFSGGPIAWRSKLQTLTALSTQNAEYVALCAATTMVIPLRQILQDLGVSVIEPTLLLGDNAGTITTALDPEENSPGTKYFLVKKHFVKDHVANRTIRLQHVTTKDNIADLLTKGLTEPAMRHLLMSLNMDMTEAYNDRN